MPARARVTAAGLLGAVTLLTGCADPAPPATTTTSSGSTSESPTSSESPPGTPSSRPTTPAKRAHVTIETCTQAGGYAEARGTVDNPGSRAESYRLQVFFTDHAAKVLGSTQVDVTAAPGASTRWTARTRLTVPADIRCVLGEVR